MQNPTKGIQTLPERISTDLTTLAGQTVLTLGAAGTPAYASNTTRIFLLKKIRYNLAYAAATANEPVIIACVTSGSGDSNYDDAIDDPLANPDDPDNWLSYVNSSMILRQSLRILMKDGEGSGKTVLSEEISIGGRKGIPFQNGFGPKLVAYNPRGSTLTTGSSIQGLVEYIGVWLDE